MSTDSSLSVKIEGDELVIRVGIDQMAYAFEECPLNDIFNEEIENWKKLFKVVDSRVFVKDVISSMLHEAEDGSSPLILFLEEMCVNAVENGSLGVTENK